MSGVLAVLLGMAVSILRAVIGVGTDTVRYGYDNYSGAPYGSLSVTTFGDHAGNTRTITGIGYVRSGSAGPELRLSGTGITNSDATFVGIRLTQGGTVYTFLRSAGTYTSNDTLGNSLWSWGSTDTSAWASGGNVPFEVF